MLDMPNIRDTLRAEYDLAPNPDLAANMQDEYARMARVVSPADWAIHAPYVAAINALKRKRNATILAHNYMTPEIYHGIGDVVGDSLQLAIAATQTDADVIVQCGVHFMAETSKILNPGKTVLMPDMQAGCSLAESITPAGIAEMRARYPGAPVVTYVNTTADVKAASDICCTSANAVQIIRALDADTIIMTPDQYLAQNVAAQVPEKNASSGGKGRALCMNNTPRRTSASSASGTPEPALSRTPECPPDVVAESDFSGSTKGILDYVSAERPERRHAGDRMFHGVEYFRRAPPMSNSSARATCAPT